MYAGYGKDEWCGRTKKIIKILISADDVLIKLINSVIQVNVVVIYTPVCESGKRTQELEFCFRFIGKLEILTHEPTTSSLAGMQEKERSRLRNKEYDHKYRGKKTADENSA